MKKKSCPLSFFPSYCSLFRIVYFFIVFSSLSASSELMALEREDEHQEPKSTFRFPIADYEPDDYHNAAVSLVTFKETGKLGLIIEKKSDRSLVAYSFSSTLKQKKTHFSSWTTSSIFVEDCSFSTEPFLLTVSKEMEDVDYKRVGNMVDNAKVWRISEPYAQEIEKLINIVNFGLMAKSSSDDDVSCIAYIEGLDEQPSKKIKTREDFLKVAEGSFFSVDRSVYVKRGDGTNLGSIGLASYNIYSRIHKWCFGEIK